MKPFMGIICTVMLFVVYRTTNYQYQQTEMDSKLYPFYTLEEAGAASASLNGLPRGIIHARSDFDLKPLWLTSSSKSKPSVSSPSYLLPTPYLLAIPVGIKQKDNVDTIVQKFLSENFTVVLFHYDGKVDGWWDLEWSNRAIHIVALNQTKWCIILGLICVSLGPSIGYVGSMEIWHKVVCKRFLHPSVVSPYDYIFLWDEDLGVEHFNPRRYLEIVKSEGLEISQPALDPNSTGIHHRITVRSRTNIFHRRVYEGRGSTKCSDDSQSPPCTGFVEGMAPVFSRSAWHCAWHLIQNDLVLGWGMDMKLGYCAQRYCLVSSRVNCGDSTYIPTKDITSHGTDTRPFNVSYQNGDRTKKVGVVDSEYIVHQAIQTLGGTSARKGSKSEDSMKGHALDERVEIRRQSALELQIFKERWEEAVKEDRKWVDPFRRKRRRMQQKRT